MVTRLAGKRHFLKVFAICLAWVAAPTAAVPEEPVSTARTAEQCLALQQADFLDLQDAPTQIMSSEILPGDTARPESCHVQGYVAPQVNFEIVLPLATWNGKFIHVGCGGNCGWTRYQGEVAGLCDEMLRRGYACIGSDRGHSTSRDGKGNAGSDSLWAFNNLQAEVDFGSRATHVVTLAGKAIVRHFYSSPPRYSYMFGCSGGGRQGLMEAQRFPWDFDGIVALEPSVHGMMSKLTTDWIVKVAFDQERRPLLSSADLTLLHGAVLAVCDGKDGLEDGIITNPATCSFRPRQLACAPGQKEGCLDATKIRAIEQVYAGPTTSAGEPLFYGPNFGAELAPAAFRPSLQSARLSAQSFGNMAFVPDPGSRWTLGSFDYDADYKRMGMMEALISADNPDLRRFKRAGGKLLIAHGWNDSGLPLARGTIDYYETVERVIGGEKPTQQFARLFMVPGRGHCVGGDGAAAIDFLTHLENWVERKQAPDVMIAAAVEGRGLADYIRWPTDATSIKFTRPVFPYPYEAHYRAGDPNDYRSFVAVLPRQ